MALIIREIRLDDARSFVEVHRAAVRVLAARDYPTDVIESWAPLPVTEAAIDLVRANKENYFRVVAEIAGRIVGMGALDIENGELRACYVAPEATRNGVGTALVREMERVARHKGLKSLKLDSSTTAEAFYANLGYEVVEYGHHTLGSGLEMACVKMRKDLASRGDAN